MCVKVRAPEGSFADRTAADLLSSLALLGVAFIWGWTFILIKESLIEIPPLAFLFYRSLLAFTLLLVLFAPRLRGVPAKLWLQGMLIGVALFGGYALQTWGLLDTTATKSAFLTGLSVVWVPLLGAAVLNERINRSAWLGAFLAVLGLGLIILSTVSAPDLSAIPTSWSAIEKSLARPGMFTNRKVYAREGAKWVDGSRAFSCVVLGKPFRSRRS